MLDQSTAYERIFASPAALVFVKKNGEERDAGHRSPGEQAS